MTKNNKKVIKKVIYCLVLLVLTLILKSKVTYAVTITYYPNMEVYTTKEFFVKNTTKAGEWSVYTLKTGTNPNNVYKDMKWKDIVKVTKRTDRGYTRIECEALNAGTVRIYVRDNVTGVEKAVDVTVNKRDITRAYISLSQTSYTYNNTEKTPKVTAVKLNGCNIYDYYVQYSNNVQAGDAYVYVVGKGNNCGTAWRKFTIYKRDISNAKVVLTQDYFEYEDRKIYPQVKSVTINNGKTPIYDYRVQYKDNKEQGTGIVQIIGTGSNTGIKEKKFYIAQRDISRGIIILKQENNKYGYDEYEYNAYEKKPEVSLWIGNREFEMKKNADGSYKDFYVNYYDNIKEGKAEVFVRGKNSYKGSLKKTFTIVKRNISSGRIEVLKEFIETGNQIKPSKNQIKVLTKNGGEIYDYDIKSYGINKFDIGTITIKGKNNNTGEITGAFQIYKNISKGDCSLLQSSYTYTGSKITPNVILQINGTTLKKGTDYTLSYEKNVNVGTAIITVNGIGKYRGTRTVTFKINPKGIDKADITLSNTQYTYTGKEIEPSVTVKYKDKVLRRYSDYDLNFVNNIYARGSNNHYLTVNGKGNFTGISKKFYFNINYRDISGGKIKFTKTYVKTGKQIKPKKSDLEVYAKNGARIYDFEITGYGNNIQDKGTVTVSGINNNKGKITGNFEITKKTILKVAEEIHQYMDDVGYGYNTAYLAPTFEESKKYNSVVCSTYVGWVLKELNLLEDNLELNNCKKLEEALLYKMNWQKIPGDKTTLQPGDIIIYGYLPDASGEQHRNHTDIYVGDGKKLNAGHELGPNTKYGHYDSFCEKYITGDLEEGWDRYWVYRPKEYK